MPKLLESKDETCLIMKDATHGLDPESTSVMDIKIGTRSYAEDVSTRHVDDRYVKKLRKQYGIVREICSKREYMKFRDSRSTTASMGFRVTAMSVPIQRKRYTALTCGQIEGIRWYDANGFENTAIQTLQFFAYDGRSVRNDPSETCVRDSRLERSTLQVEFVCRACIGFVTGNLRSKDW